VELDEIFSVNRASQFPLLMECFDITRDTNAPAISVSKDTLFLYYTMGWHFIDSFYVKNIGNDTLHVDTLSCSGWLKYKSAINPFSASIPPRDSTAFEIILLIPVDSPPPLLTDTLTIFSNDPKQPQKNLIVRWEIPQNIKNNKQNLDYVLEQNYPNPFNPETKINFSVKKEELVRLEVFNSIGEMVTILLNSVLPQGEYSTSFDATDFPSGVYIVKMTAGNFIETKKMILVR
jgi:hypothetical protein